jgi:hypothetical protein
VKVCRTPPDAAPEPLLAPVPDRPRTIAVLKDQIALLERGRDTLAAGEDLELVDSFTRLDAYTLGPEGAVEHDAFEERTPGVIRLAKRRPKEEVFGWDDIFIADRTHTLRELKKRATRAHALVPVRGEQRGLLQVADQPPAAQRFVSGDERGHPADVEERSDPRDHVRTTWVTTSSWCRRVFASRSLRRDWSSLFRETLLTGPRTEIIWSSEPASDLDGRMRGRPRRVRPFNRVSSPPTSSLKGVAQEEFRERARSETVTQGYDWVAVDVRFVG